MPVAPAMPTVMVVPPAPMPSVVAVVMSAPAVMLVMTAPAVVDSWPVPTRADVNSAGPNVNSKGLSKRRSGPKCRGSR